MKLLRRIRIGPSAALAVAVFAGGVSGALLGANQVLPGLGVLLAAAGLTWFAERSRDTEGRIGTVGDNELEQLAVAVQRQWRSELQARGLTRPMPISTSWSLSSPEVMDHLPAVLGNGGRDRFDGQLAEAANWLLALPRRRAAFLGPPGSGKTVLAVSLTVQLHAVRKPGEPVPVLLPLNTWNPDRDSFQQWLTAQLLVAYPTLARRKATELVQTAQILPILDGFDEIPTDRRGSAITRLNHVPDEYVFVLTSREDEFRNAVSPRIGRADESLPEVVAGTAVVRLLPIPINHAVVYLREASHPAQVHKWDPIAAHLAAQPDGALAQVLTNPLMIALCRTAFSATAADPEELLDSPLSATDIEHRLLQGFLSGAYSSSPKQGRASRWSFSQASRYLRFLARWSAADNGDVTWWRLPRMVPGTRLSLLFALSFSVAAVAVAGTSILVYQRLIGEGADRWFGFAVDDLARWAIVGGMFWSVALFRMAAAKQLRMRHVGGFAIALAILNGVSLMTTNMMYYGHSIALFALAWIANDGLRLGLLFSGAAALSQRISRARGWTTLTWLMTLLVFSVGWYAPEVLRLAWQYLSTGSLGAYLSLSIVDPLFFAQVIGVGAATTVALWIATASAARSTTLARYAPATWVSLIIVFWAYGLAGNALPLELDASQIMMAVLVVQVGVAGTLVGQGRLHALWVGLAAVTFVLLIVGSAAPEALLLGLFGGHLAAAPELPDRLNLGLRRRGLLRRELIPIAFLGPSLFLSLPAWPYVGAVGAIALFVALVVLLVAIIRWMRAVGEEVRAVTPRTSLNSSRTALLRTSLAIGLLIGLLATPGLLGAQPPGIAVRIGAVLGLAAVGGVVLLLSLDSAWVWFNLARLWFVARGDIPLSLFAFLDDARERGVLRQVGAVYQFRHRRLFEYVRDSEIPAQKVAGSSRKLVPR